MDAIVVIGVVDDSGSVIPGWDYPFSKAEETAVESLKERGYKRIRVFREPDSGYLRKLLNQKGLRAVYFIGHGEFILGSYSFHLNGKNNLSPSDLRTWAMEDKIVPVLSGAAQQRISGDSVKENALQMCSGYDFDLAVMHSCNSFRDPEMRSAIGWAFEGNPWYSTINLPPLCSFSPHLLRVDSEAFSMDPMGALENAIMDANKSLHDPGHAFVQPGYSKAFRSLLSDLIDIRSKGSNELNKLLLTIRKQFRVQLIQGGGTIRKYSLDELKNHLGNGDWTDAEKSYPCEVPTRQSKGLTGCSRSVIGGGPCWQHEFCFEPPDDQEKTDE
jgi:hypothetical protein